MSAERMWCVDLIEAGTTFDCSIGTWRIPGLYTIMPEELLGYWRKGHETRKR